MNDASAAAWSGAEQFDAMGTTADPDFSQMLDLEDLGIDFSLDYATGSEHNTVGDLADSLDIQHLQSHYSPAVPQEHGDGTAALQQQAHMGGMSQHGNNFFDFGMASYPQANANAFSQGQGQMFRPHHGVPPTPNSIEMHGDPGRYLQMDPQQVMYDPRFQMRKDDAAFTPLVSPAVTPHDQRFQIPDMTAPPEAFFSPLTSPALTAQNQQQQQQPHPSQYTPSGSSTGASPAEVEMEKLGESAMTQPEPARKLRSTNKRNPPRSSNNPSNRVRQSPIVKPGRRKATVSSLAPPKEVTELVEEARTGRPISSGLEVPLSREGSEGDSISPEPLLEMGPPPKPHSVTHSPAIQAQSKSGNTSNQGVTPATPASLMRIQPSPQFGSHHDVPPMLEDLTLPEASLERSGPSRPESAIQDDEYDTPRLSARKTPKLNPLSTPSGGTAKSGKASPQLSAASTPTSPAFATNTGKKGESKPARNIKKRNSVSSNLVSPAIRPKISPSIKPLLPEGGKTGSTEDNTHALLLASKSNYQNLVDGTTVPGVVYPTSLSTNLSSKRTSHKIAEQGRRNRINTALQEMQALLPSPQIHAREAKSPDSGGAQSNNSKAAKVESAIEYIKELQKECTVKDQLINQKEVEMEALRKELEGLKESSASKNSGRADSQMKTESQSSQSSPGDANVA